MTTVSPPPADGQTVGYTRYVLGEPLTACQTDAERAGWRSAHRGQLAALCVESTFAAGGSPQDADRLLAELRHG